MNKINEKLLPKHILYAKIPSNFDFITGSYTEVATWQQSIKIGDKLSISSGKVKIGPGVKYIKLSFDLGVYSATSQIIYFWIRKNGVNAGTWTVSKIQDYGKCSINDILAVDENDVISVSCYSAQSANLEKDNTNVIVEVFD